MDPFEWLVGLTALGFGAISLGIGSILITSQRGRLGLALVIMSCVLVGCGLLSKNLLKKELMTTGAVAAVTALVLIAKSAVRFLNSRPKTAAATLTVFGLASLVTGAAVYEHLATDDNADRFQRMTDLAGTIPPLSASNDVWLTDCGSELTVMIPTQPRGKEEIVQEERFCLDGFQWGDNLIYRKPASDLSNCHGWVFTDGKGWVLGHDVPRILEDHAYQKVDQPKPGDLAIYRGENGEYRHTAIVRSVGDVVMVEGKWGWMGVYLHEADRSCYGTMIEYYRSDRKNHLVHHASSSDALPVLGGAE